MVMKKLSSSEFGELMCKVYSEMHINSNLRLGQTIFNTTYTYYPELANSLRATEADCFHNDNKIIHFVNAILAHE